MLDNGELTDDPGSWIGYLRERLISRQIMEWPQLYSNTLPSELWEAVVLRLSPSDILLMRLVMLLQPHD